MEDRRGKVNRNISCAFDRIIEEFNAEQLHQVCCRMFRSLMYVLR